MKLIQEFLLKIYSLCKTIGLTENSLFQKIFLISYFFYKKYIEDPFFGLIKTKPELFKGGHILDIGANIGYTSTLFSKVVTPGFKVYAFEPEKTNFERLNQIIDAWNAKSKIIPVCAAVGASDATAELWYNESHHGDHRIVTQKYSQSGINLMEVSAVEMRCIDSFVKSEILNSAVKFIKIDVQGYELPVCLGMEQTLTANPDAIVALEYDPRTMSELGFVPEKILKRFQEQGYFIYILHRRGALEPARNEVMEQIIKKRGYLDLIFSKKELLPSI
jgi:FkbM family methyltransferase